MMGTLFVSFVDTQIFKETGQNLNNVNNVDNVNNVWYVHNVNTKEASLVKVGY